MSHDYLQTDLLLVGQSVRRGCRILLTTGAGADLDPRGTGRHFGCGGLVAWRRGDGGGGGGEVGGVGVWWWWWWWYFGGGEEEQEAEAEAEEVLLWFLNDGWSCQLCPTLWLVLPSSSNFQHHQHRAHPAVSTPHRLLELQNPQDGSSRALSSVIPHPFERSSPLNPPTFHPDRPSSANPLPALPSPPKASFRPTRLLHPPKHPPWLRKCPLPTLAALRRPLEAGLMSGWKWRRSVNT